MKQWIEKVHFCSISSLEQFSLPLPPILSAFPPFLSINIEPSSSGWGHSLPGLVQFQCSVPTVSICDITKTLNTVGFCLSCWRDLEDGSVGPNSASFTSFLHDFGQVMVQLCASIPLPVTQREDLSPTLCFQVYRTKIFARAEHSFIQIQWEHKCLGWDPSLSSGSILRLLTLKMNCGE